MLSLSKHGCANTCDLLLRQAQDEVSLGNSEGQTGHFFSAPSSWVIAIPIDLFGSYLLERTAALNAPTPILSPSCTKIGEP
jgi:hypothetical protein